eukprot:Gb_06326 [translate_table: standard]
MRVMTALNSAPSCHVFHDLCKSILVDFSINNQVFISSFCTSASSHLASSSTDISFIQEFLQKSCGLSLQEASLASKSLIHVKSTKNPEQVLQFFKERGFTDAQIRNTVTRYPKLLVSSVHKTLQPKLRVFEDLGILGTDLGTIISRDPKLLRVSVGGKLLPGISFLRKMVESNDIVVRILTRETWVLHVHLEQRLKPNILFLESIGFGQKLLSNLLLNRSRFLLCKETLVKDVVNTVSKFGIPPQSGMFPHALSVLCSMNKKTLERKINFFISLGLSEEQVLMAFRKSPFILATSEKKLQDHMDFAVNTLKYEPSVIVNHQRFFMASMESTIIPRYRVLQMLQSMNLPKRSFSLINAFCFSEKIFLKRFVFRYPESSILYELYKGIDGSKPSPHLKVKEGECEEMEPQ